MNEFEANENNNKISGRVRDTFRQPNWVVASETKSTTIKDSLYYSDGKKPGFLRCDEEKQKCLEHRKLS